MKKERLVKCYGIACEQSDKKHPKSELIQHSSKNYCASCMKEIQDRDELYEYVKGLIGGNGFSSREILIKTQIKRLREKEGLKYKGMKLTLEYMTNVEGVTLGEKGVGLLPYYYDKAREWFVENLKKQEQIKDFEIKEAVVVVAVSRNEQKYKNEKLLNMEDLVI